jgi:hypothetical protein
MCHEELRDIFGVAESSYEGLGMREFIAAFSNAIFFTF